MFNTAVKVAMANAATGLITHAQLHSGNAGPTWATLAVGSRVAVTESVDANGVITFTANFTGLTANQAVGGISYWSASSGGTNYGGIGGASFTGDATANSAGEYSVAVTENPSAFS